MTHTLILAPPLAIIFMCSLEKTVLATWSLKPSLFRGYIDDIIVLRHHGREPLNTFITHMNKQHPFIQFTSTDSDNDTHSIDFLDLTISISPEYSLELKLFIKSSHGGVHLSFLSSLPLSTKCAVAKNQYTRARQNSSHGRGLQEGTELISQLLRANNYPENEIQRTIKAASKPMMGGK